MRNKRNFYLVSTFILFILVTFLVLADFGFIFPKPKEGIVEIQADPLVYSPNMSSTVGIGLIPKYASYTQKEAVKFHWNTNYGYFVSWGNSDYVVRQLGKEVVNNGEKIFWTYDPNEAQIEKENVIIHLWVEDATSGKVLAKTFLEIKWKNRYTAEVIK